MDRLVLGSLILWSAMEQTGKLNVVWIIYCLGLTIYKYAVVTHIPLSAVTKVQYVSI